MMSMIFDVIAKTASIKPTNGAETGAGRSVIAMPTIKAKNIMCSIFGLAPEIELKTLLGTMVLTPASNPNPIWRLGLFLRFDARHCAAENSFLSCGSNLGRNAFTRSDRICQTRDR